MGTSARTYFDTIKVSRIDNDVMTASGEKTPIDQLKGLRLRERLKTLKEIYIGKNEMSALSFVDDELDKLQYFYGLKDTLLLAEEEIDEKLGMKDVYVPLLNGFDNAEFNIITWRNLLKELWSRITEIEKNKGQEVLYWNGKAKNNISRYVGELQRLAPWADMVIDMGDKGGDMISGLMALLGETPFYRLEEEINSVSESVDAFGNENSDYREWCSQILELLENSKKEVRRELDKIRILKNRLNSIADETDFKLVYDKKRQLFSIGYDVEKESKRKPHSVIGKHR
jgi:hypothetical protein